MSGQFEHYNTHSEQCDTSPCVNGDTVQIVTQQQAKMKMSAFLCNSWLMAPSQLFYHFIYI